MNKIEENARIYLTKSEDDLLHEIGEKSELTLNSFPKRKDEFIEDGKNWLNENLPNLQHKICNNSKVKKLLDTKGIDDVTLYSAIADLITSLSIGFAPFSVAALLVKRGLHKLCKTDNDFVK
jgi:hypothetical protein